eukprot:TRINITY_DN2683_c1_g1_i1.p1 TRINITY_DN2683_c1_g1~~TRINITY_DN2683_c1_g1_i1.p1  ORF type:complete len:392 (-),score=20.24 TRINITY_DN2683_c1_g1_i1:369-1544(-)
MLSAILPLCSEKSFKHAQYVMSVASLRILGSPFLSSALGLFPRAFTNCSGGSFSGSRRRSANIFRQIVMEAVCKMDVETLHSELIILGSGSSTGVPTPSCVISPTNPPCEVCHKALELPPESNPNYRCNPSMLIKYRQADESFQYIQIDCGKNFKEQVLRWFVRHKIPRIDALILTHDHADAVLGIDDLRGVQPYDEFNRIAPMPVFLSRHCLESLKEKFDYLMPKPAPTAVVEGNVIRRVTQLTWHEVLESTKSPFDVCGLQITPLPVMHGEDYVCLGFLFGTRERVAYISDVSRIPPETEALISYGGEDDRLDLLILDALYRDRPHNTHFSLPESLETIKRLRPRRALLLGLTHEFDHERDNEYLREWSEREGLNAQLCFDGMLIPVKL